MKLKSILILPILILSSLFAVLTIAGCYTKLSYFEPMPVNKKHIQQVKETEESIEHDSHSDVKKAEAKKDAGESNGYYGRRKSNYGYVKRDTYRSYTTPYASYPYYHYPHAYYHPYAYYHPNPWYYGYGYGSYSPYYPYYRSYYPYRYSGRYYGRTYYPAYRGSTYNRGTVSKGSRAEYRRSRASRSVTSSNPRSERLRRRSQN